MRHKYGAVATEVDGIRFASKAEARRYGELKLLQKAGRIEDLQVQPTFALDAGGEHPIGVYRGDFAYYPCYESGPHKGAIIGHQVVEDVKGMDTPLSKWKRKHVLAQYGIAVEIVR